MSSARGNSNASSVNEYEQQKLENVERNKRMLESLKVAAAANDLAQHSRPKKTRKKTYNIERNNAERPNLRPRLERNNAEREVDVVADLQPVGAFLSNNEDQHNDELSNGTQKKRTGRGVTKKEDIFSRTPDMPKINILLNERGQPVGKNARQLSSFIGCQVRKKLPLTSVDWRLVPAVKKYDLWTELKTYYDIDDVALNWVMRTAGRKWKEFKATIKELYFDPEMDIEECGVCPDKRVNDDDWKFLFKYWKSSEFQARSKIAKANRAKLELHHTSGSISYACSEYDLAMKLGCPPRRDENFIKTHTRKNGVPIKQAEQIINDLKEIVEAQPELRDRTIQEGDAFAAVCGEKEPRGYVRVMGLGPTPQDIGTPGLKCYIPTRLQMAIFARMMVESEKATLQQRVLQLQAEMEERAQQYRASVEPMSQNGSTSRQQPHLDLQGDDGSQSEDDDECYDEDDQNCDQALGAASSRPAGHITRTNDAHRSEHDAFVGKDVILYALLRTDQPVAKGTIISTKPSTTLGGQQLGREFCEVIVTCVLKRDALLPRPYGDIETMADALMMSVAWPYKKLKMSGKASKPPASGTARR